MHQHRGLRFKQNLLSKRQFLKKALKGSNDWWLASWQWYSRRLAVNVLLTLVLLGLGLRSLPYLVPIRAMDLGQDQQAVEFVDRNGLPLGTVLTRDQEHTVAVPLSQVSSHFLQAIVAAEDGRFYQHGALDGRALVRALLEAMQARQIVSGASTITMQLARMLDPAPRTLPEKLKEIWSSWRLSAGMTKDEILQAYINRLPMGGNIYGVEAAARIYFDSPASDLNVAQASLLAAIPNDPTRLNPYDRWASLKERQTYVLDRMVHDHSITRTQADKAFAEALSLQPRQQGIIAAPHFLFWLASQPSTHMAHVRTTLDRSLQQFTEAQVQQVIQSLAPHNVHHAAAIVLDNHSGEVLAYVGSPNYFADMQKGRNDGVQALRQPGSTLKPFLYELALEKRVVRPNTVLADVPTRYAIPGAKLYTPSDYSETFQGPVRVRVALANSLNVPAVRVLETVGVPSFLDRLHQLGFAHLNQPADYYGLGLTLGGGEVSLWELARAYLTLANQGQTLPLKVSKEESEETVAKRASPVSDASLSSASSTWALITEMLGDSHARAKAFGVSSLLSLPFPAAVKTGTSSDFRDTWTVGFTRDYTVAVWVGNFDGEPMRQVSGVTGAAPVWHRLMLHLHEQQEPTAFPPPTGLVKRPICALSGARPTPACMSVVQEYLYPADLNEYDRQPDPFYRTVIDREGKPHYRLKLPPEYNEWLAMQPVLPTEASLRLLSPRDGDVFLLDAGSEPQRLQFKLASDASQTVEWRLNGQLLETQTPDSVFWVAKPGQWTLQVKSGDVIDRVSFTVQVAKARSSRRGFSFGQAK